MTITCGRGPATNRNPAESGMVLDSESAERRGCSGCLERQGREAKSRAGGGPAAVLLVAKIAAATVEAEAVRQGKFHPAAVGCARAIILRLQQPGACRKYADNTAVSLGCPKTFLWAAPKKVQKVLQGHLLELCFLVQKL